MWVETDADGETERATVQESRDNATLVGCSSVRGTGVLHQCTIAKRCATVRDAGSCCNNTEVREGALVSDRGSFSIRSVSSLTEISELGDQLLTSQ